VYCASDCSEVWLWAKTDVTTTVITVKSLSARELNIVQALGRDKIRVMMRDEGQRLERRWYRWAAVSLIGYTTSATSKGNGDGREGTRREHAVGPFEDGFKVRQCPTYSGHNTRVRQVFSHDL
jgi:hypothetical protein